MSEESADLIFERGADGKIHWTGVIFHGLEGDACKDAFEKLKKRAQAKGWVIDVKEYIPHHEVIDRESQQERKEVRTGW
jgi:hypothetical protein